MLRNRCLSEPEAPSHATWAWTSPQEKGPLSLNAQLSLAALTTPPGDLDPDRGLHP